MIFVQMKLDFSSKRQPLFKTTIKISTPFDHFYRGFITLMTKLSNVRLCKIATYKSKGNFRSELPNNAQLCRYLCQKFGDYQTKCTHLDKTANVLANNEFSGTIITPLTMGHKIHAFLFTKQQGGSNNFKISQGYLIKYQLVAGWCLFYSS